MKRPSLLLIVFVLLASGLIALPANALLIDVNGPPSAAGVMPAIIAAPQDVNNNAAINLGMEGFNERQDVTLAVDIMTDQGLIGAGTEVDSHMIFIDNFRTTGITRNSQFNVQWTFEGYILGVMSDLYGALEVASSGDLGAIGTLYPQSGFEARGLEDVGPDGLQPNDGYIISGNVLTVGMRVTNPGDWIRVVTAAEPAPVPEPATMLLLGTGLVGLAGLRRKFKK